MRKGLARGSVTEPPSQVTACLREEEAIAASPGLKYDIFMAVAESIGHDKRGATKYRRTPTGEDVLRKRTELVPTPDGFREIEVGDRVVDDELPDVGEAYRRWLSGQQP